MASGQFLAIQKLQQRVESGYQVVEVFNVAQNKRHKEIRHRQSLAAECCSPRRVVLLIKRTTLTHEMSGGIVHMRLHFIDFASSLGPVYHDARASQEW